MSRLIHVMQPIVLVIGTRPEGIKMIPVYKALKDDGLPVVLCSTMQHDELLTQVFELFDVKPDFDLQIMRHGQDLFYLTQSILQKTKNIFKQINPSIIVVQGDTTSTMAAALSAFYLHIPVCHIEAGLRTDDIHSPFPEEMNRRVIGSIADIHCAPTSHAAAQLLAEGVDKKSVFCTGNTVVDALRIVQKKIDEQSFVIDIEIKKRVDECKKQNKKIMLLTVHRRESFDGGIVRILKTVKEFLQNNKNVFCFYPFHPNPCVVKAIKEVGLSDLENIYLSEPVSYKELAYLLLNIDWAVTDSGGIQEEAVSLSKPVLVLREKTERAEGVWSGLAVMVGTDEKKIKFYLNKLFLQEKKDSKKTILHIYGDGYASEKISQIIKIYLESKSEKSFVSTMDHKVIPAQKIICHVKEKVSVLGLGYIGLPTSIVMAEVGLQVFGFDIDKEKVEAINNGDPVIQEPELFERLNIVLQTGNFIAKTELKSADYFVIAVPTPFKKNKKADLSYVFDAAEKIATVLQPGNVVLLESTVPVGATDLLAEKLQNITGMKAGKEFFVAHCPERVLPGKIFHELICNSRIVGGINNKSTEKAKDFYSYFVQGEIYTVNVKIAEMVKLVENSSRDSELAFAHQIASMAYEAGLNPYEVIELANKHPRVNILQPSCGVGGHCIAVDPWFLIESFPRDSKFLQLAREVNDEKPKEVVSFIKKAVLTNKKNKPTVLLFGLTYKPNVDDMRESPALVVARMLEKQKDINLLVSEPHLNKKKLKKLFGDSVVSVQDGISKADIIVFLVSHTRFRAVDIKLLQDKTVLDFCGILYNSKTESTQVKKEQLFKPARSDSSETMKGFFSDKEKSSSPGGCFGQKKDGGE